MGGHNVKVDMVGGNRIMASGDLALGDGLTEGGLLGAGDLILTGTPAGVGDLAPGMTVSITIEGLGTLTNPVEEEPVRG